MSKKNDFERFGKYLILDHLVDGGMAKICRARFLGEQSSKIVAIKMVQQQFSKDPAFVQMFEDELKVTFGLLHPNIAQMFDYGMVNDQLYTAMEYIDGRNLKEYLDRLKEKKFVFPVDISTYIISQVCQALHYAHSFTDKLTGKPMNIIHRDISPHNIMLTYDGAVKVIDFGIAKADSNSEATQAGTIKGKLSYLAPEYLDGLDLDPRYDEFAVGITLWELLCGRKLFTAANDLAILKKIQNCEIPAPSSINPNVPKELDEIVFKALSKDRTHRYEDMDKLNRALIKFLYSNYPDFNASDLGYFAQQLFKKEIAEDKAKFVTYGKIDIQPYLSNLKKEVSSGTGKKEKIAKKSALDFTGNIELDLASSPDKTTRSVRKVDRTQIHKSARTEVRKKPGATSTNVRRNRNASDKTRTDIHKKVNSESSSMGLKLLLVAGAVAAFAYFQPGLVLEYTGVNIAKYFGQDSRRNPMPSNPRVNSDKNANQGLISFSGLDPAMDVFINNKRQDVNGISISVSINRPLNIRISQSGFQDFNVKRIILDRDNSEYNVIIPDMVRESSGNLTTSKNYEPGTTMKIKVHGVEVTKTLPLQGERLPAGTYDGYLYNPVLDTEKKVKFTIEENKKTFLD